MNHEDDWPNWQGHDPEQGQVFSDFAKSGTEQWTYVYRSAGRFDGHSYGLHSALLSKNRVDRALNNTSWDLMVGGGRPGFSQSYLGGKEETTYHRFSSEDVEPIVFYRDFHGLKPRELELSEEFRLLFDLWEDRSTRTYYYFDDAGKPEKAATIDKDGVRVLSGLLRRYQAARGLYLALYIDSTRWADDLPDDDAEWALKDKSFALSYYRGSVPGSGKFSRLVGKKILAPPPREKSGFWPWEVEQTYEDFIIGVDELGNEVTHTSNPDKLGNYFGKNPDSPHYLKPVFFRREVLDKYYANPDLYSVEDGYIRCAALWGLSLDNDLKDYVVVFLGDLGRDIARSEAQYWRSFNVPPQGSISETLRKRAFLAEFTDPQSVDLRFARTYGKTNASWEKAHGWPLFKQLHKDDRHVIAKLHIPLQDTQAEFDEQIGYLAKLLVDSINEEAIVNEIGKGSKDEKGLGKFQRYLSEKGFSDAATTVRPFANVQGLRSRGAAHRKGADFDLSVAIGDLDRPNGFRKLLEEAVEALESLTPNESAVEAEPAE